MKSHSSSVSSSSSPSSPSSSSSQHDERFPQKLYSILTYERLDSLTWFEDGSGFRITDPRSFESTVINKYFSRKLHSTMTMLTTLLISLPLCLLERKIRSFFRQLNTYGFVRVSATSWRDKYSFCHPLFQRGLPHLLRGMQRRKPSSSRKRTAKAKTRTATESSDDTLSVESSTTPNQTSLSSMSSDSDSCCSSVSSSSKNKLTSSCSKVTIPSITHPDQLSTVWMNEEEPRYDLSFTDEEVAFLKEIFSMDSS